MSRSYSIRSLGQPYFVAAQGTGGPFAAQEMLGGVNAPVFDVSSAFGAVLIDFALYGMPTQLAAANEAHILFSYHEWGPAGADLCYVGVTPAGSLIAYNTSAAAALISAPGVVVADGVFRRYAYLFADFEHKFLTWDFVAGDGSSFTYGETPIATATYIGAVPSVEPAAGRYGMVSLFNGRLGRTLAPCAIRCAIMAATNYTPYWPIDDKSGTTLRCDTTTYNTVPPPWSGALTIQNYDPVAWGVVGSPPYPWGPVPERDVQSVMRWQLKTPYERIARPKTTYTRIGR